MSSELNLIRTIFKGSNPIDFSDICEKLQTFDVEIRSMIKNNWTIMRIKDQNVSKIHNGPETL